MEFWLDDGSRKIILRNLKKIYQSNWGFVGLKKFFWLTQSQSMGTTCSCDDSDIVSD
jgi:hypothetical protein